MLAVAWVTKQVVFDGFVSGLAIGLVAVGIVLVYRSTRVINFAVGNMGLVGAGLLPLMVLQYHSPFWLALIVCLVVGTLFAVIVQLGVIRRLFAAPRVIVLVATVGIGQLALTVATAYPKVTNAAASFPVAVTNSWQLGGVQIQGSELAIIIVAPLAVLALSWFLVHTDIGKSVKAAADNPPLARISGVNPKLVSTMVWAIAGLLSSLSLILIAGQSGTAGTLTLLGPETLVRALTAAVIGGMRSFPRTVLAAVGIGVVENLVNFNFLNTPGLIDFVVLIAVLIAVWFQSRERAEISSPFSFTPKPRPIPERLRAFWWIRVLDRSGIVFLAIVAVALPIVVTQPSRQLLYAVILSYAICGTSLTILTGWAGQVSLGQMAFAGIGALIAATLHMNGVPFWLTVFIAAACTTVLAAILGIGSLRVRGLLLVVTTFAFALAAEQYFYNLSSLNGNSQANELFPRGTLFGASLLSERSYYYAVLFVLVVVLFVVSRLRRSGIGRRMIAVRDNPDGAAAYTVSPTRAKMQAFALAGAIAGLGGALLAGVVQAVPFGQEFFLVNDSLVLVSLVVIGGLGSTMGPILGALWVVGLPAFAPANQLVALLTSSIGLLILLLYFPSGLVGVAYRLREGVVMWTERRMPEKEAVPCGQRRCPRLRSAVGPNPCCTGTFWSPKISQ
jgi:ABC-type branched-subunit amino acid transport system permease subunit